MSEPRFQTLILDLDDTLIPTSDVLIPPAIQEVHQIMQEYGLKWTLEEFNTYRKSNMNQKSHREIFKQIVDLNHLKPKEHIIMRTFKAFYEGPVPNPLPLLPGALSNLQALAPKYNLFLMTGGRKSNQRHKIKISGIEAFFNEILVVDESWDFQKIKALEFWIKNRMIVPERTLSLGNRLKDEIKVSKKMGLFTCHIRFGEHAYELPETRDEIPDFSINNHAEFISTCQL